MSDILIKGMGIPKDCKYVDVRIFRDGTATTSSAEEPFYKKMDVVEVPTPHGDLIDRDALIKQARTQFDWNDVVDVEDITNAPTIIPAEKNEQEKSK